jgi:hypothetical protein
MDEMLKKLLENELLSDETKKEIAETFRTVLEGAKADQEKALRAEFAERYDADKEKIAEAVEQFVAQRMEGEIQEFHADMKGLAEQRLKYVNAQAVLKEQAQTAIRKRLEIFEKALRRALVKETKELHEDLKVNRKAALSAIREAKEQAEADRHAFRVKGAKVLEHIINVKLASQMQALQEDIEKAKQNDFGARIYEAFIGEARRMFFNSHKELRNAMKMIAEQKKNYEAEKAQLVAQISETQQIAKKAIAENRFIKEKAIREQKEGRLLAALPAGEARARMKTLLEASTVADMEKTFKKYASDILTEVKRVAPASNSNRQQFNEHAIGVRNGNGRITVAEEEDDEDVVNLRRLSGIVRK